MVVDVSQFTAGIGMKTGGFYLLEQLPGYVHFDDLTQLERLQSLSDRYLNSRGYFASYNIAFFPDVYEIGGTKKMWEETISLFIPRES